MCFPPLHSRQFGHSWDVKVNKKYAYASERLYGDQGQGSAFGRCTAQQQIPTVGVRPAQTRESWQHANLPSAHRTGSVTAVTSLLQLQQVMDESLGSELSCQTTCPSSLAAHRCYDKHNIPHSKSRYKHDDTRRQVDSTSAPYFIRYEGIWWGGRKSLILIIFNHLEPRNEFYISRFTLF